MLNNNKKLILDFMHFMHFDIILQKTIFYNLFITR